eukprot:gene48144-58971_t
MPTASERQARRVQRYYRWLDGLSFYRERRAAGEKVHPVHRALADPGGGPPSPLVIHRLMLEGLDLPGAPRVLDAGCGYGATMLDLAPILGGDWTGLTLSPEQAARGNAAIAAAGLADRVRVEVRSYDAPPEGPFDLIYGIESLIHSADPAATLRGLAARLAPGDSQRIQRALEVYRASGLPLSHFHARSAAPAPSTVPLISLEPQDRAWLHARIAQLHEHHRDRLAEVLDASRAAPQSVADVLPALARLRITVFRDFPYLYDGDPAYEAAYL